MNDSTCAAAQQPDSSSTTTGKTLSRFLERELVWLTLLVTLFYATRLTDLSIRGEESRRGRIAWEMLHSGDWLVPRVQGLPRLSRPPLHYWAIAICGDFRGTIDAVAVRLPSFLATLCTVLVIYGYGRCWMSRTGAFASAAAYATFAQVLQLGRLGETEAIFTFLLSAALLIWHAGILLRWSPWLTWTLAYTFAAAATLTKGPQAPVYFAGGIGVFLLLTRQWRSALSWSHAAGIALFLFIVLAWQIPFTRALGQEKVSYVYLSEVAKRFEDTHWSTIISHLTLFPFEIVVGCLFPWSLLLLAFGNRKFRGQIGAARLPLIYLAGCIAIAFPTVWIPPEARSRYFMPLFPCFALLCGYVVEQSSLSVVANAVGWVAYWRSRPKLAVSIVTCLLGGVYVGPIMSYQVARSRDAAADVAEAKQLIPHPADLASFGVVHHLFSYHYGEDIAHYEWPEDNSTDYSQIEYFCFDAFRSRPKDLPFPWVEVARVNCDRNQRTKPEAEVIIARRLPAEQTAVAQTPAEQRSSPQSQKETDGPSPVIQSREARIIEENLGYE